MKKIAIILLLAMGSFGAYAQQDPIYSEYMFNGMTLNPAYAGNKGVLNLNGIFRRQWTGIGGSPTTMTFSGDAPIERKRMGVGLYVQNDKLGAESRLSAYGSFAYKIPVSYSSTLSFGLSFGMFQYSLDGSMISLPDNQSEVAGSASVIKPDAKFGVYYSNDNFYAGASVADLLGGSVDLPTGTQRFVRHYYLTTGYIFSLSDAIKLYPSMLLKDDALSPTDIDFNSFVLINKLFWVGVSYRTAVNIYKKQYETANLPTPNALSFMFQIYATDRFRFGYAYDAAISDLKGYAGASHEISIAYMLPVGRTVRMLSPRYF